MPQAQVNKKTKIAKGTLCGLTHHTVKVSNQNRPIFFTLTKYPFPKKHTFINKIFNRNKAKVSYSCMQNIKAIINKHNMNILHQNNQMADECNSRNKKYCPLGVKCLSPNIVYQGKITSTQPNCNNKVYFGVAEK